MENSENLYNNSGFAKTKNQYNSLQTNPLKLPLLSKTDSKFLILLSIVLLALLSTNIFLIFRKSPTKKDITLTSNSKKLNPEEINTNNSNTLSFGKIKVLLPDETFSSDLWAEINPSPPTDIIRVAYGVSLTYDFRIYEDKSKTKPLTEFDKPFTIIIDYSGNYIEDVNENTLSIYWLGEQEEEWLKLDTKLQIENKLAIASFNKPGKFALLGELKVQPPPIGYSKIEYPLSEWKTFTSNEHGFSIKYPPNWKISNEEYNDKNKLLLLYLFGDYQSGFRETAELFDGAILSIYHHPQKGLGLYEWVAREYSDVQADYVPLQITETNFGGNKFYKVSFCNSGAMACELDYFVSNRDQIFQFNIYTRGKDAKFFESKAVEIISTLEFTS